MSGATSLGRSISIRPVFPWVRGTQDGCVLFAAAPETEYGLRTSATENHLPEERTS